MSKPNCPISSPKCPKPKFLQGPSLLAQTQVHYISPTSLSPYQTLSPTSYSQPNYQQAYTSPIPSNMPAGLLTSPKTINALIGLPPHIPLHVSRHACPTPLRSHPSSCTPVEPSPDQPPFCLPTPCPQKPYHPRSLFPNHPYTMP